MKKVMFLVAVLGLIWSCSSDDAQTETFDTPEQANQLAVGTSANDLLSDNTFTSLVIELVYVEGFEPSQTAVNNFVSFLEDRTFKPDGITVQKRAISTTNQSPYTNQEIIAIEDANRTLFNNDNQITVWVFFADGESASNTDEGVVLGTAYRNTSFVIYQETIQELTSGTLSNTRPILETTVITHEFGHILGLTNLGSDLQSDHEDLDHPKHCDVESCLMYWQAESGSNVMDMISGGNAPQLDAQCIADLQANGGK
ncbi:membrane metalloprotease [Olleya sp. YSTF-M6]|uniref:Membrane metalloprotease n=1 Tax=Olleya sediminilitoris TaxID=2795739 RepID=A0ABS1WLV2_9FLAO|nr:membrane metalloprotease [Olleya sediminilitoris]MBL7560085.1 membrane metalloprotease [Olleya sediminilitoris]